MNRLISILDGLKIQKAFSVDDDYSLSGKLTIELISIDDYFLAYREKFSPEEIQLIEDEGFSTVGDLLSDSSFPREIKSKVTRVFENANSVLSVFEKEFQGTPIEFKKFSKPDEITEDEEDGILWVLDKEICGEDVLRAFLPKVASHDRILGTWIFLVFTYDDAFDKMNESQDQRLHYLQDEIGLTEEIAKRLSYSFFVVSKKKLIEKLEHNEIAAQRYIESVIVESLHGFCIYNVLRLMKSFAYDSFVELEEATKDSQKATIKGLYYNLKYEGEHNLYFALSHIQNFMQEKIYSHNYHQIGKYLLCLKKLALIPEKEVDLWASLLPDYINHYEWAHLQFLHEYINADYSDIAFGDTFIIEKASMFSKEQDCVGVIITQPCDCVLRTQKNDKFERKAKDFTMLLFPIMHFSISQLKSLSEQNKDKWERTIKTIRNNAILIGKKAEGELGETLIEYFDASSPVMSINIASFIADLTTLSDKGKAIIPDLLALEQTIKQKKPQCWEAFYPSFSDEINAFIETERKVPAEHFNELIERIYNIPFCKESNCFSIRRIGRLESNLAEFISSNYVSHTYRTGKNSLLTLHYDYEVEDRGILNA